MHLGIYECDRPSEALLPRFGSYADMFEAWLGSALPEARFSRIDVAGGAALPAPGALDGVLITGARAGVPDGLDWVAALMVHLRELRAAGVRVAGICFGHQVMAAAWGGQVARAGQGWQLGRHLHDPTPEGAAVFGPGPLAALSVHRDQVVAPPPGAVGLLAAPASPHGGFRYGGLGLSVQVHPELHPDYVAALLEGGLGTRFDPDLVARARAGLGQPLDAGRMAAGFAAFFRGQLPDGQGG